MQLHLVAPASVPLAGDQVAFGPELVKMLHGGWYPKQGEAGGP